MTSIRRRCTRNANEGNLLDIKIMYFQIGNQVHASTDFLPSNDLIISPFKTPFPYPYVKRKDRQEVG